MEYESATIFELAGGQHGVVSSGQLKALGLSGNQIAANVRRGWLRGLHRGVYAVGHRPLSAGVPAGWPPCWPVDLERPSAISLPPFFGSSASARAPLSMSPFQLLLDVGNDAGSPSTVLDS
jgi:hypothetical protein